MAVADVADDLTADARKLAMKGAACGLTATATDGASNTSELSAGYAPLVDVQVMTPPVGSSKAAKARSLGLTMLSRAPPTA